MIMTGEGSFEEIKNIQTRGMNWLSNIYFDHSHQWRPHTEIQNNYMAFLLKCQYSIRYQMALDQKPKVAFLAWIAHTILSASYQVGIFVVEHVKSHICSVWKNLVCLQIVYGEILNQANMRYAKINSQFMRWIDESRTLPSCRTGIKPIVLPSLISCRAHCQLPSA